MRSRTNRALFYLEGEITVKGNCWIVVQDNIDSYKTEVKRRGEDGKEYKETVEIQPSKTLICFSKAQGERLEKAGKLEVGKPFIFGVNTVIDKDIKTGDQVIRYWLVNIFTYDQHVNSLKISNAVIDKDKSQGGIK